MACRRCFCSLGGVVSGAEEAEHWRALETLQVGSRAASTIVGALVQFMAASGSPSHVQTLVSVTPYVLKRRQKRFGVRDSHLRIGAASVLYLERRSYMVSWRLASSLGPLSYGAAKARDWACGRLSVCFRSTGTKVKTQGAVTAVDGNKRGDLVHLDS